MSRSTVVGRSLGRPTRGRSRSPSSPPARSACASGTGWPGCSRTRRRSWPRVAVCPAPERGPASSDDARQLRRTIVVRRSPALRRHEQEARDPPGSGSAAAAAAGSHTSETGPPACAPSSMGTVASLIFTGELQLAPVPRQPGAPPAATTASTVTLGPSSWSSRTAALARPTQPPARRLPTPTFGRQISLPSDRRESRGSSTTVAPLRTCRPGCCAPTRERVLRTCRRRPTCRRVIRRHRSSSTDPTEPSGHAATPAAPPPVATALTSPSSARRPPNGR